MTAWGERAAALAKRAPDGARVAELGYGVGNMARTLAAIRPDLRLVMVDSFLAADEQPERYRATGDNFAKRSAEDSEKRFGEALALARQQGWQLVRGDTVAAAQNFSDGAFDLVFIDADHSEAGVARDIAAWLPKVRGGGWIGGHDYANDDPRFDFSGVKRAVDAAFPAVELDANFTWWARL